jgi:5'-nucleotidase
MKTILLTGDDGYNSLGTRVLVDVLKHDFDLAIVGTKKQQSGVGGFKSIQLTGAWGETTVDGIQAFWIDGSPVDAMELAKETFPVSFDYIISGINWGANIGGCLLTSGTFSAAAHGVNLGIAKRAIAISWDMPATFHFRNHSIQDDFFSFVTYPGKSAYTVIKETIKNACWGADVININLPQQPATIIEFVKPLKDIYTLWPTMQLNKKTKIYAYNKRDRSSNLGTHDTDVQALSRGHITISPCQSTYLHTTVYKEMMKSSDAK